MDFPVAPRKAPSVSTKCAAGNRLPLSQCRCIACTRFPASDDGTCSLSRNRIRNQKSIRGYRCVPLGGARKGLARCASATLAGRAKPRWRVVVQSGREIGRCPLRSARMLQRRRDGSGRCVCIDRDMLRAIYRCEVLQEVSGPRARPWHGMAAVLLTFRGMRTAGCARRSPSSSESCRTRRRTLLAPAARSCRSRRGIERAWWAGRPARRAAAHCCMRRARPSSRRRQEAPRREPDA
jgi:hypothetical protein